MVPATPLTPAGSVQYQREYPAKRMRDRHRAKRNLRVALP
jgi:hypothetical protein